MSRKKKKNKKRIRIFTNLKKLNKCEYCFSFLVVSETLAPFSNKSFVISAFPISAAQCKQVALSLSASSCT